MMKEIYGNKYFLDTVQSMMNSGRLSHSFLIYGEKGLGKKTAADYLAKKLLCQSDGDKPCGICRACRLAENNSHPDIIRPEQSGKLKTYTVETARKICANSYVKPNDGNRKVYIFSDADNIQLPAQNALLKIVEEPPEFTYFIFTASAKSVFLPTILSRVVSVGVSRCSEDECLAALAQKGYDSGQISKAQSCFGGNIGMCINYLENDSLQTVTALTKKAVNSIINKDEYGLLTALSATDIRDREMVKTFLEMLDKAIRDAIAVKFNPSLKAEGCCFLESEKLGTIITAAKAEKIHSCIYRAVLDVDANVSTVLIMSALCGEIMNS